ncbi:hypothetical protein PVK06_012040 [Gossypium arboreum]|uniref:Uncharacterized protein n=1 Tax=Gossypium arboreum TaxID=29729 RepID=A0ABR0QAP7_GOSAR|nr:hypothetical protein PVK06_012040 [Gossypium arboreum]
MAGKLNRLDKEHISVEQRELPAGSEFLARGHDRLGVQVGPEINQCVDRKLQLGLPVDGYTVIESAQSANWGAVCYELLGAIPDNINGGQIEMGWLQDIFSEPDNDSTELERIRYARTYIL